MSDNSSTQVRGINYYPLIIIILVAVLIGLLLMLMQARVSHSPELVASDIQKSDQETFEWRLVTSWPKNFPGLGETPERFAKMVNEMSNGRLRVRVYGGGELVPALGVFDAVSSGSVEMGHSAAYYWKGKIAASVFFTSIPFGLNAVETSAWLHEAGGMELWRQLYSRFNLIPFAGGSTGVQMAGWFNKEINSLDDIKGLKMRIPGLAGEIFQRLGGTAISIPGAELYTAMQTGVIDSTEWVGPYNDSTFGLHEVANHYYYPGWHEPGSTMEFIINASAWDSLPKDLQAIAKSAMMATHSGSLDNFTANNSFALTHLKDKYSIIPEKLPDSVVQGLRKAAKSYYREQVEKDPDFARVYHSYMEFYRQVEVWHNIAELSYLNARKGFSNQK